MNCIDLNERFGDRFQIAYEESYTIEHGEHGRTHDPWLLVLRCRHGEIYPHGRQMLGASTNKRGAIAGRLARLPCVHVVQDGDDGINAVFDVDDFEQVAAILKPRRRRRLAPEQRAEQTERLRRYQFSPASQSDFKERRSPHSAPIDQRSA